MMGDERISRTQLMALLWAGLLAPVAETLPGALLPRAGRAAWLAAVLAIPVVLLAGALLGRLAGEQGLARAVREVLGPRLGGGVLLIYMVWALVLLSLRLRLGAQRLLASGDRDGALWFFLLAVGGVLLWVAGGTLPAFARAGQLFLAALLLTAGAVLALSVPKMTIQRLLPVPWPGGAALAGSALRCAGVALWGLFGGFLLGRVKEQGERRGWHWLFWGGGGMALLAAAQGVILGALGSGLAAQVETPFFTLAKSVGVEGAFQRVEGIVAAQWVFADLAMGGVLVFAVRELAGELLPKLGPKWPGRLGVAAAALGALTIFRDQDAAGYFSGALVPAVDLALGLGAPAFVILVKTLRRGAGQRRISCGESPGKTADIEPQKKSEKT